MKKLKDFLTKAYETYLILKAEYYTAKLEIYENLPDKYFAFIYGQAYYHSLVMTEQMNKNPKTLIS